MNIAEALHALQKRFPQRLPGTAETNTLITEIKKLTDSWDCPVKVHKIPVYHFKISLWILIIGSLGAVWLSFYYPWPGLILAFLLWLLVPVEFVSPIMAKLMPSQAENLIIDIPARSKENQKIILITPLTTDSLTVKPPKLSNRLFIILVLGLGLFFLLLLVVSLYLPVHTGWFIRYFCLLPLLGILSLTVTAQETEETADLTNCAILLELGAILTKARPYTTSVTLYFSGARSLNSGVLKVPGLLKSNPKLSYIVNLVEWADKRINLITCDGFILPQASDSFLVEILTEVAREKAIPVQAIKLNEISTTYPLKIKQLKSVSITNPGGTMDSAKQLRELLIGLIRKVDH